VKANSPNKVAIIMGSKSDYPVMKECEQILKKFGIKHDVLIVSAHRTPERLYKFAKNAHKNYSVVCSGAGRAAHLSGMCASLTKIPVIGVPIKDNKTDGIAALLASNEMPSGIPVATTAINGAKNAGLLAISIIALQDKKVRLKLENYRIRQTKSVKKRPR
jgi:5-(carboxyamino)imidazole ribonucleotide mutase